MEEFERKLKRAGFRNRRDARRARAEPMDPQRKTRRNELVRRKLKKLGLDGAVCLGCGSSNISTFQFDHVAGRKYHPRLFPLCEVCHQEKTYVLYLDPPQTENPNNVFAVIARVRPATPRSDRLCGAPHSSTCNLWIIDFRRYFDERTVASEARLLAIVSCPGRF